MANDKITKTPNTSTALTIPSAPEGFVEDVRSIPLYNVEECMIDKNDSSKGGYPIQGYPVGMEIYGKAPDVFKVMIVKLTKPTKAWVNEELVTVDAGKEIAVRGADIRDLERYALNSEWVTEFYLRPTGEKMKMKPPKQAMPIWERRRSPKPVPRKDVAPNRLDTMSAADVQALYLEQRNPDAPDTSFDPKQIGA